MGHRNSWRKSLRCTCRLTSGRGRAAQTAPDGRRSIVSAFQRLGGTPRPGPPKRAGESYGPAPPHPFRHPVHHTLPQQHGRGGLCDVGSSGSPVGLFLMGDTAPTPRPCPSDLPSVPRPAPAAHIRGPSVPTVRAAATTQASFPAVCG